MSDKVCEKCGLKVDGRSKKYRETSLCEKCFNERFFVCDSCGEIMYKEDRCLSRIVPKSKKWCVDCVESCKLCGKKFKRTDLLLYKGKYLCKNCKDNRIKQCPNCGREFGQKRINSKYCEACRFQIIHKKNLRNIEFDQIRYLEFGFAHLLDSSTRKLMSRLNNTCEDDPFDILFVPYYEGQFPQLVIVHESSNLFDKKSLSKVIDSCTMTEFKKGTLFFDLIHNEYPIFAKIKWNKKLNIHFWKFPLHLRAQTYGDMDYRKEYCYGDLVYEGNNYGDTSDFYIIGVLK